MPDATITGPLRTDSRFEPCGRRIDAPWFCVWTKPNQEHLAENSLRSDGYPTFFPLFVEPTDRTRHIQHLFPRYGFVQPNEAGQWVGALYARGVSSIIRTVMGQPRRVPDPVIDRLFSQCHPNGCIYPPEAPQIERNTRVRIQTGPFADLTGVCSRTKAERVWILMEIMGREKEIEFPRATLEAIDG